jgi:protein required for attachment to host cells
MAIPVNLLFVLTDGGRARLVERAADSGAYSTIEEIDGAGRLATLRQELRASPPARSFSSTSPRRAAVGPEDYMRPAKEAFVREVAERAVEVYRAREFKGVVVAAPSRLISDLKRHVEERAPVAASLRKDLTKAPDHELGAWLDDLPLNS